MSDDESLGQIQSVKHKYLVAAQTTQGTQYQYTTTTTTTTTTIYNHELLLQNSSHSIPYCIYQYSVSMDVIEQQ